MNKYWCASFVIFDRFTQKLFMHKKNFAALGDD